MWSKNLITGEIIQRGNSGVYSSRQIKTITLPIAFTTTNYMVFTINNGTSTDNFYSFQPHNFTTTNFKIRCQDNAGSSNGSIMWIAIGY
ncbi:gp53-like domain-containing protein [Fusobacterium mortiferum]